MLRHLIMTTAKEPTSSEAAQLFHAITAAADNANIGVAVLRVSVQPGEVEIVYLNRATERLASFTRPEIMARGFWSFVPSSEVARVQAIQVAQARGEDVPSSLHTTFIHRDGRHVPIEVALGTVTLNGAPALVLFISDLSSRRAAEEALQRSEAQFRQVVHNAPDGIFILRWPTVLYANPAGARLLELNRSEDAVGLDISKRIDGASATLTAARIASPREEPRHFRGRNPGGSEFAVDVSTIAVHFEGAPAVLAFARDVSERNDILARLREAEKLAAVHALAAGVAHEINNPLAYVLLNLEFLERELPELGGDPQRAEALQRRIAETRHGAERVKNIVRDLQALTRKDEGIRGAVELDQIIEHALHLAKRELHNRVQVTTQYDRVPCVLGNPTRLEQLFFNLLMNAAHAVSEMELPERKIRVCLCVQDTRVIVEIEDNGCGMSEQVVTRAFEPFFTTKALGVGAGLGLAICKRIVDDLGGQITLHSRPLHGTTVQVCLPGCNAQSEAVVPAPKRLGRLLLIDDERAVAESLRHALQDEHDIDTALCARDARAILETGRDYDVVLCDLAMPVESGADLYAYVLAHYPDLAERFVFMTGGAFTARSIKFLEESRRPHVEKPFELDALRKLLATFMQRREP